MFLRKISWLICLLNLLIVLCLKIYVMLFLFVLHQVQKRNNIFFQVKTWLWIGETRITSIWERLNRILRLSSLLFPSSSLCQFCHHLSSAVKRGSPEQTPSNCPLTDSLISIIVIVIDIDIDCNIVVIVCVIVSCLVIFLSLHQVR
jgi:hypothetical protein